MGGAADPAIDPLAPCDAIERLAQALRNRSEPERGTPAAECNSRQFQEQVAQHLPWHSPEACATTTLGPRVPLPPSCRPRKFNSTLFPWGAPGTASMITISHKHRFIYIEITKCATTTLWNHFVKTAFSYRKQPEIVGVPKWLKRSGIASDLDLYSNYLVFTFVRNPFDRFLSFFLQGSRAVRVAREDGSLDRDYFNGRRTDTEVPNLHILPPPYTSLEECAEQTQQGLW